MPDRQRIQLPFPIRGVVEGTAYHQLPPGFTPRALNVWPFDRSEERMRGGKRPGLKRLVANPVDGLNIPITKMKQIALASGSFINPGSFFTDPLFETEGWEAPPPSPFLVDETFDYAPGQNLEDVTPPGDWTWTVVGSPLKPAKTLGPGNGYGYVDESGEDITTHETKHVMTVPALDKTKPYTVHVFIKRLKIQERTFQNNMAEVRIVFQDRLSTGNNLTGPDVSLRLDDQDTSTAQNDYRYQHSDTSTAGVRIFQFPAASEYEVTDKEFLVNMSGAVPGVATPHDIFFPKDTVTPDQVGIAGTAADGVAIADPRVIELRLRTTTRFDQLATCIVSRIIIAQDA